MASRQIDPTTATPLSADIGVKQDARLDLGFGNKDYALINPGHLNIAGFWSHIPPRVI